MRNNKRVIYTSSYDHVHDFEKIDNPECSHKSAYKCKNGGEIQKMYIHTEDAMNDYFNKYHSVL